jgi:5-formyltetrahydrofolate cyclo-ligase
MEGKSFKMVPFRLPLKRKKFGIMEAGNSLRIINKIDIAIVPVVGIDKNLQRVGFGKGMYDRFFPTLKQKPFTVFVQLEPCITKKRLCDAYDIRADYYISSSKNISRRLKREK